MISDHSLEGLRLAAALAHELPLPLRLCHGERILVEVARAPLEWRGGAPWLSPCQFRASVARAYRMHQQGRPVAMCGLPGGADPVIEVALTSGARERPGGIYALPVANGAVLAFATTARSEAQRSAADRCGTRVHADEALDAAVITIVGRDPDDGDALAALESALADLTVCALLDQADRHGEGRPSPRRGTRPTSPWR